MQDEGTFAGDLVSDAAARPVEKPVDLIREPVMTISLKQRTDGQRSPLRRLPLRRRRVTRELAAHSEKVEHEIDRLVMYVFDDVDGVGSSMRV